VETLVQAHRWSPQVGHDDWVRAVVFHPNGQFLLTASDDHTFRIWDLKTGRNTRKVEAHEKFVTSMTWGRQAMNATASTDPADPNAPPRLVNVIATASSDQVCPLPSRHYTARSHTVPTVCQNMASTTMISFIYFLLLQSFSLSQRMIESFFPCMASLHSLQYFLLCFLSSLPFSLTLMAWWLSLYSRFSLNNTLFLLLLSSGWFPGNNLESNKLGPIQ